MNSKDIKLWDKVPSESDGSQFEVNPDNEGLPSLTPYVLNGGKPRPAMIVCPGGDMKYRAAHEGAPIAEWLNEIGITAFILT